MELFQENILLPDFYNHLVMTICNGIHRYLFVNYKGEIISGNEISILNALKTCSFNKSLFSNIINPSDKIVLYYLSYNGIYLLKDVKLNPSKNLIIQCISINDKNFKDYRSIFNDKEIIEILENNTQSLYLYKNIDDLTLEMSKLIISKNKYLDDDILKYIKYWDKEIIDMIINRKDIVSNLNMIPNLSLDDVNKVIIINPLRLKCYTNIILDKDIYINSYNINPKSIEYIPTQFQTDYMHTDVRNNHLEFIIFLRDRNQNDFDKLFSYNCNYIRIIPEEFQTILMSKECVVHDVLLLNYCYCIDHEILKIIFKFKSNRNIPKKDRFNFIINFEEDALIRIIKAKASILKILPVSKQTDKLIKEILQYNGYALEHVIDPTKEQINLALLQEPKAIKYVKTL